MGDLIANPPVPAPAYLASGDLFNIGATQALTANTAYLAAIKIDAAVTLTGFRVQFGSGGNGHYDCGLYNFDTGALVTHTGSLATAAGVQSPSVTALVVPPGRYWLAFFIDNATDTIVKYANSPSAGMAPVKSGTVSTQLPNNISGLTGLANGTKNPVVIGLLQNGWS